MITKTIFSAALVLIVLPAYCFAPGSDQEPDRCPYCRLPIKTDVDDTDFRVTMTHGGKTAAYRCVLCALADAKSMKGDLEISAASDKKGEPVKISRVGEPQGLAVAGDPARDPLIEAHACPVDHAGLEHRLLAQQLGRREHEIVNALPVVKKAKVEIAVVSCFSIGLGAGLTPLGEPLTTIVISKLSGAPYYADFMFLFDNLAIYILPAVIALGFVGVFLFNRSHTGDTKLECIIERESIRDIVIRAAKVYDVAVESPLEPAPAISRRMKNMILLKREDKQPVFSFKLRGAYNKMAHLREDQLRRGVICASAGNHAQGVALAAQRLGAHATIVMPVTTPRIKVQAVAARGAKVELQGDSYHEAYLYAKALARKQGMTFVHPYDDPLVIAGQGTTGREIVEDLTAQGLVADVVAVTASGGGLTAGIALAVKARMPQARLYTAEPEGFDDHARSFKSL